MVNIDNTEVNWNNPANTIWCFWHDEMMSILVNTNSAIITDNYAYYIAPWEVHTILMNNEVYTLIVEGVWFVDWLRSIVEGGDTFANVVCTECQQPENVSCQ